MEEGAKQKDVESATGRPRSARVHQAILDATMSLLGEFGFEGMSMEGIAARAGASKATIYRRWSSKEEVVAEALRAHKDTFVVPGTGSLRGDLLHLLTDYTARAQQPLGRRVMALMFKIFSEEPERAELIWEEFTAPKRDVLEQMFLQARERGDLHQEVDIKTAVESVYGAMMYLMCKPSSLLSREQNEATVTLLLQGMGHE